ncbi:hypothetical protein DFA_11145 [Cavenderia fasciculata]|uniref:C2 domain-containing protein n=1 Tax=Cavenderia fasciculata TaxID=261658 RepID=F4QF25_CACFS|nr:uncharacterized protein DFA_11145 [Cavenderia fasciculata]EGG13384.1 hypothetical protein DFA_11145 [Cavenderia fasciculata]|eukprot:XP_004350088.1 hypothetical protein DFA_11145 [Cavenderia fasciculata]
MNCSFKGTCTDTVNFYTRSKCRRQEVNVADAMELSCCNQRNEIFLFLVDIFITEEKEDDIGRLKAARNIESAITISSICGHIEYVKYLVSTFNITTLGKWYPQVLVYQSTHGEPDNFQLVGASEKIKNNLNPTFKTPVKVDYYFEALQPLQFVVVNVDGPTKTSYKDLAKHDIIGSCIITLSEIVSVPGRRVERNLNTPAGSFSGMIDIKAEFFQRTGQKVLFQIACRHLDKKDLFGKSDPYFKIFRKNEDDVTWTEFYQSKVIMNELNPIFEANKFPIDVVCGGNLDRPIKFEFFDWDKRSAHDLIGIFETTLRQLQESDIRTMEIPIVNVKKDCKSGYKNSGICYFKSFYIKAAYPYSILDFIAGGTEIGLMVAIDCTVSNGPLHNIGETLNQYEQSILGIGRVLEPYDTDRMIPVYGYGGSINGVTSHCFPFDVIGGREEAAGIYDVQRIYRQNMSAIGLSSPTNMEQILKKAVTAAEAGKISPTPKYTILLIITDGDICDLTQTKIQIVKGSKLPLSIVIVGVGSSAFFSMNELDGDMNSLKGAVRDIVQFVPFAEVCKNGDIAKETLKEIPKQFIRYFKKNHITPPPPRPYIAPPYTQPILYPQ